MHILLKDYNSILKMLWSEEVLFMGDAGAYKLQSINPTTARACSCAPIVARPSNPGALLSIARQGCSKVSSSPMAAEHCSLICTMHPFEADTSVNRAPNLARPET